MDKEHTATQAQGRGGTSWQHPARRLETIPGGRRRGRSWANPRPIFILVALAWLWGWAGLTAQADLGRVEESKLKAAFLFNFIQFMEWPATNFTDTKSPICIGVLGDDPFGALVADTVKGEVVRGRPIVTKLSQRCEDAQACHLLFVSANAESGHPVKTIASLAGTSVATVGETAGFAKQGGVFNFLVRDHKLRFEINLGSARSKGLKISSQLLKLAKIVGAESANEDK